MHWSSNFAYVVGLIASDGNLSKDGRHIDLTSKDLEQILNFKRILNLSNKIGKKYNRSGSMCYRIQFGNIQLYRFLTSIGLYPNKTKTLSAIAVPDKYFRDFLRGQLDGDGYTYSYWDKRWKSSFLIYTGFTSASKEHLEWIQGTITKLYKLNGALRYNGKSTYILKYAKHSSIKLLKEIYHRNNVVCLTRKKRKVEAALKIINGSAGMAKMENAQS